MDQELEAELRRLHEGGSLEAAATLSIERYGPEIYSFLVARMRDEDDAADVFSQFAEDLWRGIGGFGWRCSFLSWMYVLARNAAARYRRLPANQAALHVSDSCVRDAALRVRTRTRPYLRTDVKDRFAVLRESLDPDDQTLLILRLNRGMAWNDIALVLEGADPTDELALKRASARVRQRFQTLKELLRERAQKAGLLDDTGGQ